MSPSRRPSFKEVHSNISKYIDHIGGYLKMGVNPFTSQGEGKETAEDGERDGNGHREARLALQVIPPSLETNGCQIQLFNTMLNIELTKLC